MAWVSLAAAVAVLTGGCAADVTGPAVTTSHPTTTGQTTTTPTTKTTTTVAADWNPQHRKTVAADIHRSTATIHVGERLQFTARDSDTVFFSVQPADLRVMTWYGSDLTFVGLRPGTTTLTIPNYDKHIDCPNGPCAHLNPPRSTTVTVLAGPASAPVIAAPLSSTSIGRDRTVHLAVGQQLDLPAGVRMSTYSSDAAGITLDGALGSLPEHEGSVITLVGAGPGTQMIGLDDGSGGTSARLTVVIDA